MRDCRFNKKQLSQRFLDIIFSSQAIVCGANPEDICYFRGKRDTTAGSLLTKVSEGISTKATKVISEEEHSMVDFDNQDGLFSKGISDKMYSCFCSLSVFYFYATNESH